MIFKIESQLLVAGFYLVEVKQRINIIVFEFIHRCYLVPTSEKLKIVYLLCYNEVKQVVIKTSPPS